MPCAHSRESLDWFAALALNTPTQEGKRISGHFSGSSLFDKTARLWQYQHHTPALASAGYQS
jgi:hypothetical protein